MNQLMNNESVIPNPFRVSLGTMGLGTRFGAKRKRVVWEGVEDLGIG